MQREAPNHHCAQLVKGINDLWLISCESEHMNKLIKVNNWKKNFHLLRTMVIGPILGSRVAHNTPQLFVKLDCLLKTFYTCYQWNNIAFLVWISCARAFQSYAIKRNHEIFDSGHFLCTLGDNLRRKKIRSITIYKFHSVSQY